MINNNEGIIKLPKSCRTCVWFASHPYDTDEGFCFHDKALILNLSACEDVDCDLVMEKHIRVINKGGEYEKENQIISK